MYTRPWISNYQIEWTMWNFSFQKHCLLLYFNIPIVSLNKNIIFIKIFRSFIKYLILSLFSRFMYALKLKYLKLTSFKLFISFHQQFALYKKVQLNYKLFDGWLIGIVHVNLTNIIKVTFISFSCFSKFIGIIEFSNFTHFIFKKVNERISTRTI